MKKSLLAVTLVTPLSLMSVTSSALIIGPDAGGYTATDEVIFDWVDISGTGTNLALGDDNYGRASVGFSFSLYGSSASEVSIGSNGTVYFLDDYLGLSNTPIPGPTSYDVSDSFIAVYWDDLNPSAGGGVFYDTLGPVGQRRFVAQWNAVPHFGSSSDPVTAQAILFESSSDILLQYLNPSSEAGSGATIGIQDTPNLGLQWSHNQAVLGRSTAICFSNSGTNCDQDMSQVPVPATLALLGVGVVGLRMSRRRSARSLLTR